MTKKKKVLMEHIICECGYHNKPWNVKMYGTCTRCRKVLDPKAKYKYEMNKRLRLWRGDFK